MPRRPGLDRGVLVDEAAALADERGLGAVTLANLADRLNVRPPSLYNHIDGADELQRELALFAARSLRDAVARAAIGKNGTADALAVADAYRSFAKKHPGMHAATLRAPQAGDRARQRIAAEILAIVQAVFAPFGLNDEETIHAIRGFRSLVDGFAALEAARAFGRAEDVDASFAFIVRSYLAGIQDHRRPARR